VRDLSCKEIVELVTDYLEGKLSRRDRKRFERHLAACDGCTAYLEQMRRTIATTRALTEEDLPDAIRVELISAFRGWRGSR
jgi:anti-sigma factor RsiW